MTDYECVTNPLIYFNKNFCKNIFIYRLKTVPLPHISIESMIRGKGNIVKVAGHSVLDEIHSACCNLADGEYSFVICDTTKNRNLPYLSYLFSIVLGYLSENLPEHPSTMALYKFFEAKYAPIHTSKINNQIYEYRDLKSEKASDVNDVIERIVNYALENWGIDIPRQETMKDPEVRELYSQAYLNQEVEWSSFISSRKNQNNERRIKKDELV